VLVEYIDGVCMRDLCYQESAPLGFTEEHRLDVLASILDGVARMDHSGINQRDLLPRNIMLKLELEAEDSLEEGRPRVVQRVVQRVVLIDYNISVVYHLAPEEWEDDEVIELPLNPIDLFWNMSLDDFGYWVPKGWQCNRRAQHEWLMKRFGGPNALAYAPVSRELELYDP
jgi:serine/threonine protein kinase